MHVDPITEEIREIKRSLAREFDNDLERIGADLRRREKESGRRFADLPKRPAKSKKRRRPGSGDDTAERETFFPNVQMEKQIEQAMGDR